MRTFTRQVWEHAFETVRSTSRFDDGLNNTGKPGHTRDGSKAAEAHDGPSTVAYYMAGTALGKLEEREGQEMLEAIQELQIKERGHPYYGNFFWYREEADFHDSNAAFFILTPLIVLRLKMQEAIPAPHLSLMEQMMGRAVEWFLKEVEEPKLYYPNKILSDGALLLALSRLSDEPEPEHYNKGVQFFERWLDYTARRGWGWGENMSLIYIRIIIIALRLASASLKEQDQALRIRLDAVTEALLDTIRFHGDHEFVPAIRSYNFTGQERIESVLWWAAGVRTDVSGLVHATKNLSEAMTVLLCEEIIASAETVETAASEAPRERTERIFDESSAYTWIGRTARLGSVTRFPVIPGSYQWPDWGLAWQSFPAAFLVEGHQLSFLRWCVDDGNKIRTHPSYQLSNLDPALFRESWYPNIQTRTAQKDNLLLIYRGMSGIHNLAREIADEWIIHRFTGELSTATDSGGRRWMVLHFPKTQVLLTSLSGIAWGRTTRKSIEIETDWMEDNQEGRALRLRQLLYEGELETIHHPRLEGGWIVYVLDGVHDSMAAERWLQNVVIIDKTYCDAEVPRETDYLENRRIQLIRSGEALVTLDIDPHEVFGH